MIEFIDNNSETGVVTDDLALKYNGAWRAEIQAQLDEIGGGVRSQTATVDLHEIYQNAVFELLDQCPTTEVVSHVPESTG